MLMRLMDDQINIKFSKGIYDRKQAYNLAQGRLNEKGITSQISFNIWASLKLGSDCTLFNSECKKHYRKIDYGLFI